MKILKSGWKKSGKTFKKKKKNRKQKKRKKQKKMKNRKQKKQKKMKKKRVSLNTELTILKQALIQRENLEFKEQVLYRMI